MQSTEIPIHTATKGTQTVKGVTGAGLVVMAALMAMGLKLYCASTTIGTNDVKLQLQYGYNIHQSGLEHMYRMTPRFNHTPWMGSFFSMVYGLSAKLDPATGPDAYRHAPLFLRVPGIAADFLTVLVLLNLRKKTGRPPVWALVLFALSPVSFMISGYHGNIDPVMVFLLVAASYYTTTEQPTVSGLFLGLACNVKIIPLLLTPVFFFFWLHRGNKQALKFTAACVVTCLAGWSAALLHSPGLFLSHVIGYNSYWGSWGFTYWLEISGWDIFHLQNQNYFALNTVQLAVITALKAVVIVSTILLAWFKRATPGREFFRTSALAWIIFFTLAPCIAPQYMVWLAPFVLFYSPGWYVTLTATSSLYLFMFYNTISHGIPWFYGDSTVKLAACWQPWSNWPWAVLIAMLVVLPQAKTTPGTKKFAGHLFEK